MAEPSVTPPAEPEVPEPVPPWFKRPRFLIAGGVILSGLLVGLLLLLIPGPSSSSRYEVQPTPVVESQISPQQAKINELRTELEAADPATQELPFPAVNMKLGIPNDRELR